MTVRRRTLCLLAAGSLVFPACFSIQTDATPITPPEVRKELEKKFIEQTSTPARTEFGVLPSRPGEAIAIHPSAPLAPIAPIDTQTTPPATTSQKPTPPASPPAPDSPLPNLGGVTGASNPPGPFPLGRATVLPTLRPDEPKLLAAVRAYTQGRYDEAIRALHSLTPANQELVLAVLPVLVRAASADFGSDPVAAAILAEQLQDAVFRLESQAALRVENVGFCDKVDGFARYDPRPKDHPYRPTDYAHFYLEVQNLVSQSVSGSGGETHLTHAVVVVEVLDAFKNRVPLPHPRDYRRTVDVAQYDVKRSTRGPIHDFHVVYSFPVPHQPGVYTLTMELRDPATRRIVRTAPVEFRVAGP